MIKLKRPSRTFLFDVLVIATAVIFSASTGSVIARRVTTEAPAIPHVGDREYAGVREPAAPLQAPPPPPPVAVPEPKDPAKRLAQRVLGALGASTARSWSATLEAEGWGRIVSRNSQAGLIPASTQKLYVAASALKILGSDFRYETKVSRTGTIKPDGTLDGDLVLIGGGDPFFMQGHAPPLAKAVFDAGVRSVAGGLVADDTRYDRIRSAPGWKPTYIPKAIGPLSSLAIEQNWWNLEPAYLAEPVLGNLGLFRQFLNEAGVATPGPNLVGSRDGAEEVVSVASPTLSEYLTKMLVESDNFAAELIVKELGHTQGNPTTSGGLGVIRRYTETLGAKPQLSADGSGLSLSNRIKTGEQVDFLVALEGTAEGKFLRASLPIACTPGQEGWMQERLCDTPASGKVAAKTGFLSGVRSLAGYAETASGRKVWFSFIVNNYSSSKSVWETIDRALIEITSFNE